MSRSGLSGILYVAANYVLVAAEAHWHVLYRLTAFDVAAFRALAPNLARLIHP